MPELRIHGAIFILPGPSEGDGPWQFPIGAQVGTNGVNALALLGTNVLSSPVWRVDGGASPQGEPQSIADILCTNGVFRTPSSFAIEWKNTTGVATNADTDADGISDWDEVFRCGTDPNLVDTDGDGLSDGAEHLAGSNPLDADENGDGVPDGIAPAAWASNSLWETNSPTRRTIRISVISDADALSIVTNRFPDATGVEGTPPLVQRVGGITIVGIPAIPDSRTMGGYYLYDPIVWIHDESRIIFEFCSQESEIPFPLSIDDQSLGRTNSNSGSRGGVIWDAGGLTVVHETD